MQSKSNVMETATVENSASSYEVMGKARCSKAIGDSDDRMTRIGNREVAQLLVQRT